ncbi:MAG: FMN-binding glutamate synthase family protein [Planctomycetaceae bacterium]|nr:FMN-binding glutamate synthase family protein [Planctomycetaceae bacterium]
MRYWLAGTYLLIVIFFFVESLLHPILWLSFVVIGPLTALAAYDFFQTHNNVRRNYPLLGTINELIKRERHIPQEIVLQKSWEGRPFSLLQQRLVKKRADDELTSEPFGTEMDYGAIGHDWLVHSLYPVNEVKDNFRVRVGGPQCRQHYNASILNVAAMSYGSISSNAVRALCKAAKKENFAVNTGEGGISDHHWEPGCDLIWQIGTAYFGCRTQDGRFNSDVFAEQALRPTIKMIEIKISQGAKPGFGAILPASKNTREIANYRQIEPHNDVHSPPNHSEFQTHEELLGFVQRLRDLSDGKPIGIKLCLGQQDEFKELCRVMQQAEIVPDFIAIAGGEGGSGAAALDSIHHVGSPTEESLVFVNKELMEVGLRDHITLFVAGKVISGFDTVRYLALGADACYSARGMMFALGCVQSLKCNKNTCPTGITTMNPARVAGLVVNDKAMKVANYHRNTIEGVRSIMAAAGVSDRSGLNCSLIQRRIDEQTILTLEEVYNQNGI